MDKTKTDDASNEEVTLCQIDAERKRVAELEARIAELELAAREAANLLSNVSEIWRPPGILIHTALDKLNATLGRPQSPSGKQF